MSNVDIKNLKTAKRYALALSQAAGENLDEIEADLKSIDETIFQQQDLKTFFLHPVVSLKVKKDTIKEAFEGKVNPITYNFIQTLLDENRFSIFNTIYEVFKSESDRIKNNQRVEVVSAIDLDENQKHRLQEKLNSKFSKNSIITYLKDKNILGGLIIKFNDNVIDLSLKAKFEHLKKHVI